MSVELFQHVATGARVMAMQFTTEEDGQEIVAWAGEHYVALRPAGVDEANPQVHLALLPQATDTPQVVPLGAWVLRESPNTFSACAPETFAATYRRVKARRVK